VTAGPLTRSGFLEDNPPSAKVRKLVDAGRIEAAEEQYRIELTAAMMGISVASYRKQYGATIEEERRKRGEAIVYFIARSDWPEDGEPVKIGIARDVDQRLRNLQTGSPEDLFLIGTMVGGKAAERDIHRRFHECHIRGEWFRMCPALREFIRAKHRDPELDE
jgi:hypothetical protein